MAQRRRAPILARRKKSSVKRARRYGWRGTRHGGRIHQLGKNEVRQPLQFQGQYEDEETELYYNRFCYYDHDTTRYLAQDPIGLLGGNNLYAYAPNPTKWMDPVGLQTKSADPLRQKGPTGQWVKHPEEFAEASSLNEGRRKAMDLSGLNKEVSTTPHLQVLGPQKGRVSGS